MVHSPSKEGQIGFRLKTVQVAECKFRNPEQEIQKNQDFGFSFTFGVHFGQENREIIIEISTDGK